jgi:hypothetical protein
MNAPILAPQHIEDGANVGLWAGQEVVVQDVPPVIDRHRRRLRPSLPDATEPAFARAAARCEDISSLNVFARLEGIRARIAIGDAADLHRRDAIPLLGQALRDRLVGRERH